MSFARDGMPAGLPGADWPVRFAGGTASGAPASGTFAAGDMVVDLTGRIWVCTMAGSPGSWAQLPNFGGLFGDGSDGVVTLDGSTTYPGFASLAGSTYTLTADVFATSLAISGGVTVNPAGWRFFVAGPWSNAGTVSLAGGAASGATAGAASAAGTLNSGGAGAAGGTGAGALGVKPAGSAGSGNGGAGGSGSGGAGGAGGGIIIICAWSASNTGTITAAGGNGGNGGGTNCGGGGGGGGGNVIAYTLAPWTAGTVTLTGGTGGAKTGTGVAGTGGGAGSQLNVIVQ